MLSTTHSFDMEAGNFMKSSLGGGGTPETASGEVQQVEALRRGDEEAFLALVEQYHSFLIRLAGLYVRNRAMAEDVVQETWLGVLRGIEGFEGRSSLRTWISRILVNRARTHAKREGRLIPFSALVADEVGRREAAVEPERFQGNEDAYPHHWRVPPKGWGQDSETRLLQKETVQVVEKTVENLPEAQRTVITMRDVEGWTSGEVCNALEISETNQRVLLHRARSKVRAAVEQYCKGDEVRDE